MEGLYTHHITVCPPQGDTSTRATPITREAKLGSKPEFTTTNAVRKRNTVIKAAQESKGKGRKVKIVPTPSGRCYNLFMPWGVKLTVHVCVCVCVPAVTAQRLQCDEN